MFGAMLVFGVLVRSRTQVRSLSRCASVGALHASAVLCVGGLPPSDYGIHATSTVTTVTTENTEKNTFMLARRKKGTPWCGTGVMLPLYA